METNGVCPLLYKSAFTRRLSSAYILAKDFLNGAPSAMVLGDNIFYGSGLINLKSADNLKLGGTIFGYEVSNPSQYGVVSFDLKAMQKNYRKAFRPESNFAVTGLYFLDGQASDRAKTIKPSHRGELEITSLLQTYLNDGSLKVEIMTRGFAWLDTGTHSNLLDASNFVRTLQMRQGLQVGCPEEIAYNNDWIDRDVLIKAADKYEKTQYGEYLKNLAER